MRRTLGAFLATAGLALGIGAIAVPVASAATNMDELCASVYNRGGQSNQVTEYDPTPAGQWKNQVIFLRASDGDASYGVITGVAKGYPYSGPGGPQPGRGDCQITEHWAHHTGGTDYVVINGGLAYHSTSPNVFQPDVFWSNYRIHYRVNPDGSTTTLSAGNI